MIPLTRAIPERIRGGYDDVLYKSTFTLLTFLYPPDAAKTVTHPCINRTILRRPEIELTILSRRSEALTARLPSHLHTYLLTYLYFALGLA